MYVFILVYWLKSGENPSSITENICVMLKQTITLWRDKHPSSKPVLIFGYSYRLHSVERLGDRVGVDKRVSQPATAQRK